MSPSRLAELAPQALEQRLKAGAPLLLSIGTIEWHSHHLPLGLDGIKAGALAEAAAGRCHGILAPTTWWAAGGVDYPYTLRLPADLITPLLTEVIAQYIGFGFQTITVINGHYGLDNSIAVRQAALSSSEDDQALVLPIADYEALLALGARGDHAGVWETSLLWAARPDLVVTDALAPGRELPGVIGEDPRDRASAKLGAAGIDSAAEQIATATSRTATISAEQRPRFREALRAGLDALHVIKRMRLELPRAEVPPVVTATWLCYLDAFLAGRYEDAIRHASEKARDPAS